MRGANATTRAYNGPSKARLYNSPSKSGAERHSWRKNELKGAVPKSRTTNNSVMPSPGLGVAGRVTSVSATLLILSLLSLDVLVQLACALGITTAPRVYDALPLSLIGAS